MNKVRALALLLSISALAGGTAVMSANAQIEPSPSPSASPSVIPSVEPSATATPAVNFTVNDQEAMNYLHHLNSLEIQEALAAQSEALSTTGTTLVQTLLTDHQQNEQQVSILAAQKGIPLFEFQPATYENANAAYLLGLSGTTQFEPTFIQLQAEGHQDAIEQLQELLNEVSDPDIKNLITQTIPVIQRHLQLATEGATAPAVSPSPSASPSPDVSPSPNL